MIEEAMRTAGVCMEDMKDQGEWRLRTKVVDPKIDKGQEDDDDNAIIYIKYTLDTSLINFVLFINKYNER